ncbi:hypothetical protein Zmor_027050 [Zophobas morio]|uniref:5'-deoxynucleotidase HDDC2 n=1 Tax=Zophobas morio TaxID=2755281 RepID=A0AA38HL35_9CUCU|nr:hypothetical protein Zmor_027050 [Zophobas morio]
MFFSTNVVEFALLLGQLKKTKRAGWIYHGVNSPESIADHMYRMALLSFCLPNDLSINKDRCIKMSLVHDLAESIVGDITPMDNVTKEEKREAERAAMKQIEATLLKDGKSSSEGLDLELLVLWEEYELGTSKEAKLVKDLDKFEMLLQAFEYEKEQNIDLQEFFTSTEGTIKTETIRSWLDELCRRREDINSHILTQLK